jgi:hypothetical protein
MQRKRCLAAMVCARQWLTLLASTASRLATSWRENAAARLADASVRGSGGSRNLLLLLPSPAAALGVLLLLLVWAAVPELKRPLKGSSACR